MNSDSSNSFNRVFRGMTLDGPSQQEESPLRDPNPFESQRLATIYEGTQREFELEIEAEKKTEFRHLDSLTQEEEKIEQIPENKEEILSQRAMRRSFAVKRRKVDVEIKEQLKQIRLAVENMEEAEDEEKPAPIMVNLRKRYPIEAKKKVVELTKKLGACKVARWTGIPETSVRRWVKLGTDRVGVSGRKPSYIAIEDELTKIFSQHRSKGFQVTNRILKLEAQKIATAKGIQEFSGSQSWLEGYKRRNNIVYRRQTHIAQKLSPQASQDLKEFQKQFVELNNKHHYSLDAIVNIDESGIYFDNPSK